MKRMFHALVVLVMFSVVVFHGPLVAAASGTLTKTPLKVVVVSGTNYEMGVQYGEQAAALIDGNRAVVNEILAERVDGVYGAGTVEKDIQVWTYYLEKYDPELRDWLLGISRGCKKKGFKVSYADLVAIMVFPQEVWARPESPYPEEAGVSTAASSSETALAAASANSRRKAGCSSFAATESATPEGRAIVSITGADMLEVVNYVVLIAFPTDGYRFIALTNAGRVATNHGMNSEFAWVMPAAVTHPWLCPSDWGVTSEVYFHYLLQYCELPAEAVSYLDATPRGGVTGIFVFADPSGEVFVYEGGSCTSVIRYPGDLDETDFVISTNHFNDPTMVDNNLPPEWFPDTYPRYATVWQKLLPQAEVGKVDLDFTKALWLSNDWYDGEEWQTVPVPNDPEDFDTCFVPGNLCEGGQYQIIQFPKDRLAYLQSGNPQGTAIEYYWPDDPKPTGEYTKWRLLDSIHEVATAASDDALTMVETAWDSFRDKADALDRETLHSLKRLLIQATRACWIGRIRQASAEHAAPGRQGNHQKKQMARWGAACTNYATAQLYSQMVTTKLNSLGE